MNLFLISSDEILLIKIFMTSFSAKETQRLKHFSVSSFNSFTVLSIELF